MARPRPLPGTASSSRTPRASTAWRCSGAMPGPSSSTTMLQLFARPAGPRPHPRARPLAGVVQQVAQHLLQVLLLAGKGQVGGHVGAQAAAASARRAPCSITRSRPASTGCQRRALAGQALRGRHARARQVPVDVARASAHLLGAPAPPAAASGPGRRRRRPASSTASGVLSAWARLPACVRARSTTSALRSSTPVEVVDQRLHLGRKAALQAARAPRARAQRALQRAQRRQAHGHLRQRRQRQQQAQHQPATAPARR
jgi:hypothetical protein